MRNYVQRTAVTPVDVINIMNPICLPSSQRESHTMPMQARAARIGYDVYHDEEKEDAIGSTERTMGASTFLRSSHQTSLKNGFLLGSRDQGRQDNPLRPRTVKRNSRYARSIRNEVLALMTTATSPTRYIPTYMHLYLLITNFL